VRLDQPGSNVAGDAPCELPHLACFALGDSASSLVASDVPLLPESIQAADDLTIGADRELERLDEPVVVLIAARSVPRRRQRRGRRLEGGVVRDVETPAVLRPAVWLSARSRSTTPRRSAISRGLVR
jgi:hypothetical protein